VFNIGPMELGVLALVGLIVLGPEKLPGLARDAARMLRTLRELATGARHQFKEELGPEFGDLDLRALDDLRSLNPRAALSRMLFEDEPATPTPSEPAPNQAAASRPAQRPLARGDRAPFDADAT
jgi:sec-independent protein translocase protein TatB